MRSNRMLLPALILISLALFVLTAGLGIAGQTYRYAIGGVIYSIAVCIAIGKTRSKLHPVTTSLIFMIPVIGITIFFWARQAHLGHPASASLLLGSVTGYCMSLFPAKTRNVLFIVYAALAACTARPVYAAWLYHMNYGQLTGLTVEQLPPSILRTPGNEPVNLADHQDQYILLDFWHTRCGYCYEEFPDLQRLADSLAGHPRALIFSVNIPILQETFASEKRRLPYTFQQLLADDKLISRAYGFQVVPTVIIVHNRRIIFRGNLDRGRKTLLALLNQP